MRIEPSIYVACPAASQPPVGPRACAGERPVHEGVLPFADRLRIENERSARAEAEIAQAVARRSPREDSAGSCDRPTEFPAMPEAAAEPAGGVKTTVVQRVVVQAVQPGSLLDVFA